jgi:predicted enzyme related to lactoylglutathione lyase
MIAILVTPPGNPMSHTNSTIDYIEFPASDIAAIKRFYSAVFSWKFVDYGETYTSFSRDGGAGIDGGFTLTPNLPADNASTLAVLYHDNLEAIEQKITAQGGEIVRRIFPFPGGRRFHFKDPNGNELAIWSE